MGWVKLDRDILNHWIWTSEPFTKGQAWVDLILLANHEDSKITYKGKIITCERGSVNRSVSWLAERWGWSRHKVSDFLNVLETDKMITQKRTPQRTVIFLTNYRVFQDSKDIFSDNKRTTKGHIQEGKEGKEEKKNIKKKNTFNDFKQHDYDFADLERRLIANAKEG